MSDQNDKTIEMRLALSLFGGVAGLLIWFLVDVAEDIIQNDQLILFLVALVGSFSGAALICAGPLGLRRAAVVGAVISLPASALLLWASFRFDDLGDFVNSGQPILAFFIITTVPLPFLIAASSENKTWKDFETLFDSAWDIVVRYAAAWIFVGVFWGVLMLSDMLLRIVGLDIIKQVLRIDAVPPVLTGLALGMAIAVVDELADFISPFLVLRLLRLLIPMVLIVVLVFLIAVPFKGLSGLFGSLSAATILMAITAGSVTLITTGLGQNQACAVASRFMLISIRLLSVLSAILAGLAAYAVWMRVAQYGLTPDRILAAMIAALGVAYGVVYGFSALMGNDWMARIRSGNVYLALAIIVISALWLTPLINPQRISTNNQIARYEAGKTPLLDLDLWDMGRKWGIAGQAGIARLTELQDQAGFEGLSEKLTDLEASSSRYDYREGQHEVGIQRQVSKLFAILPIRTVGDAVAAPDLISQAILQSQPFIVDGLYRDCVVGKPLDDPKCVLVFVGDGSVNEPSNAFLFAALRHGRANMWGFSYDGKKYVKRLSLVAGQDGDSRTVPASIIQDILSGHMDIMPITVPALRIKDQVLYIQP